MSAAEVRAAGVDLQGFLAAAGDCAEAALREVAPGLLAGVEPGLAGPMAYALETRGKRVRPILCVAAFRAVSRPGAATPQAVWRLAAAVEIVHTYSLVHDDLPCMDDDDLRRGRPTVHRVHGISRAVAAAAALVPAAVGVLDRAAADLGMDAAARAALVVELCRAAGAEGMVGGQVMDLEAEETPVDADALEAIHRAKTGALLVAALRLGALAAGADAAALEALTGYGEHVGLAFQIVDDVLDVVGDEETLGKTPGGDASAGKATYPALFGVDGARGLAREHVAEALAALERGGVRSPELEGIARFVLERDR